MQIRHVMALIGNVAIGISDIWQAFALARNLVTVVIDCATDVTTAWLAAENIISLNKKGHQILLN